MSNRAVQRQSDQPDLFGEALPRRDIFIPQPDHVRSGALRALELLQALRLWTDERAWDRLGLIAKVEYYYGLIADDAEAEDWRRRFEAEMRRLDAAGPRAPEGERSDYPKYPERSFETRWLRHPPGR